MDTHSKFFTAQICCGKHFFTQKEMFYNCRASLHQYYLPATTHTTSVFSSQYHKRNPVQKHHKAYRITSRLRQYLLPHNPQYDYTNSHNKNKQISRPGPCLVTDKTVSLICCFYFNLFTIFFILTETI